MPSLTKTLPPLRKGFSRTNPGFMPGKLRFTPEKTFSDSRAAFAAVGGFAGRGWLLFFFGGTILKERNKDENNHCRHQHRQTTAEESRKLPPFGAVHPHVSQCLYHDSEPITQIYLSETEIDQKDEGNDKMLRKARENRQYPNPSLMRRRRQTIKHLIYN